ncbi:MAG: histidinol-phosphate transaminase, partial [Eubacteriales bacterium]|nr:histidinol-phosphate transaminase [Eubacteriales bacterium]
YGFYRVYARLFRARPVVVPLREDFTLPVEAFCHQGHMVALANPNAPTGLALPLADIEKIVASNAGSIVLIDEAYVDFGGETCLPLLRRYPNLLIVRTFSKSRSLAGGRLGYALASPAIIDDLNRVKNSFHPYSVNNLTLLAGTIAMRDRGYFNRCVKAIKAQREQSRKDFLAMGFKVNPSCTNFLFVSPPGMDGEAYYLALKERGVLVRFLSQPTLQNYVRVTVGTAEQMQQLMAATADILKEARA